MNTTQDFDRNTYPLPTEPNRIGMSGMLTDQREARAYSVAVIDHDPMIGHPRAIIFGSYGRVFYTIRRVYDGTALGEVTMTSEGGSRYDYAALVSLPDVARRLNAIVAAAGGWPPAP